MQVWERSVRQQGTRGKHAVQDAAYIHDTVPGRCKRQGRAADHQVRYPQHQALANPAGRVVHGVLVLRELLGLNECS